MRTWVAATLTVVLALSVLQPVFSANPEASLPSCCRRDGSHHCAMLMPGLPSAPDQGKVVRNAADRCPYQRALAAGHRVSLHPAASAAVHAVLLSHPAIPAQTLAAGRISLSCGHQKRGPPLPLAC